MKKILLIAALALTLGACQTTSEILRKNPSSLHTVDLCYAINSNRSDRDLAITEMSLRGVSTHNCNVLIKQDRIKRNRRADALILQGAAGHCRASSNNVWTGTQCLARPQVRPQRPYMEPHCTTRRINRNRFKTTCY